MILIVTHKEDFTADFIIEKLNKVGIPYYRLNTEDFFNENFLIEYSDNFKLNINEVEKFDSVWFRRVKLPYIDAKQDGEKLFLLSDFECLFDNLYSLIDCDKWLSEPKFVYQAENKLLQLRLAKEIGFCIPNTIVTNSHLRLKKFIELNNRNVIIKPIRQGRITTDDGIRTIFTNSITDDIIANIDKFDLTPCIIQANIKKKFELRVTVVGNKIFASKINSQANKNTEIDWRREKVLFEEYLLPIDVAEKCILIIQKLNISFGAIDLICDENGNYIFLEVNPNGQWVWIELETGAKISDEIIKYLTTHD